ncbi:MAG: Outer membrane protein assembly factor BamA [Candidatus Anoxychlamydiales bacterium]|nr:Outer membrane protein assembly factor BamA [Candidatus Anoxychlamydiales bacterium]NGX36267.1 Outer membrane protein assembly factor BamA [Candidatus Anoxychlamydiales bacterium]
MSKTSRFLTAIFFFLCTSLLAADTFDGKIVGSIKIEIENSADSSFNTGALQSRLTTQKGNIFSQTTFDGDLKKLSEDFDRIEPDIKLVDDKIDISIKLWIRPTIIKIEWFGNKKITSRTLSKELGIKPFTQFSSAEFSSALNKVKEYYVKKGYFESNITYKVKDIPNKNEVRIDIFVKEGKSGKIKDIQFTGFTKKEKSDLLKEMFTKKYNILTGWMSDSGIFKEDALEQDKMNIINYLQNRGYADAKVDINILEDPKTNKIIVDIIAHRGILYRFGKITFQGNTLLNDESIISSFLVHPDAPFSPEKIRETGQAIKDAYGAKGYIEANVYFDTHLMENEPIYNIDFYIDEGEEYKIGLIKVYGNRTTKANVILRESLLVPGQTFDTRKLKATQQRLESIGFFKSVNVYALQSSDQSLGQNYRDVHIEVEEASTGHISFSAGYSSSENVSGTVDLTENNFDHTGFFKMFKYGPSALRGGGEYMQLKGTFGQRQKNYALTWMNPYFRDSLWRVGFDFSGTFSRLQAKDYKIRTLGGSLYASYPFSTFWSFGTKYRLRNTNNIMKKKKIKGLPKDKQEAKIKKAQADNEGFISGIGSNISYDSTDISYKPHRGFRSLLEAEYVGLGGKFKFFKFSYLNAYYYPIWSKGTLKYRFDLKFIDTIKKLTSKTPKEVPMSERFFLGGETTVRGYKPYSIGPVLLGTDNDPNGGVSSLLLSMEYNQEIIKPLVDIFFFVDAGTVTFKEYNLKTPRASVGVGLRLEVMNRVPITVGWGYPINPAKHRDRQQVFFYMGGQF